MEILSQPASFSRSLRMVIWKHTDTRQCSILQRREQTYSTSQTRLYLCQESAVRISNLTLHFIYCEIHNRPPATDHTSYSPSMQEEREPEPIELVWDLGVQERQEATHIIHAMNLRADNQFYPQSQLHKLQFIAKELYTLITDTGTAEGLYTPCW